MWSRAFKCGSFALRHLVNMNRMLARWEILEIVAPNVCVTSTGALGRTTSATLGEPVTLSAGQIVQVTVTISFS
jgi:hypothetical protein